MQMSLCLHIRYVCNVPNRLGDGLSVCDCIFSKLLRRCRLSPSSNDTTFRRINCLEWRRETEIDCNSRCSRQRFWFLRRRFSGICLCKSLFVAARDLEWIWIIKRGSINDISRLNGFYIHLLYIFSDFLFPCWPLISASSLADLRAKFVEIKVNNIRILITTFRCDDFILLRFEKSRNWKRGIKNELRISLS